MSDDNSIFDSETHANNGLLQLGYLIQNHQTHPFSLTLHDLCNLLVVGPRAQDIYFNLLIQLCDDHRLPVLVIKGFPSEGLEEQVCESPLWHIDLGTEAITFDALNLANGRHPSRQIDILIRLFESFGPVTPTARNLFHVIIWRTILMASTPTLQHLQNTLSFYEHHKGPYHEIRRLLSALPHDLLDASYDNLSLTSIRHLPTIITGNDTPKVTFAINLLLLKLLADESEHLPALFLVNTTDIAPQILEWLSARYTTRNTPFVIFDNQNTALSQPSNDTGNFILTSGFDEEPSPLLQQLTENEQHFLQVNNDHVVVHLRSEPATRFITIF
ncbi:MAG: hypothetical protein ACFFCH_07420 [Promethearchaeota archaeon]